MRSVSLRSGAFDDSAPEAVPAFTERAFSCSSSFLCWIPWLGAGAGAGTAPARGTDCALRLPVPSDIRLPHEKLVAYQQALRLLHQIQELRITDARLRDQVLRAAKSVCLNIAEAVGRFSDADRKRVYAIARGECCEAAAALEIARATAECDAGQGRSARETAGRLYALLTGLIRRFDVETDGPKTSRLHETEVGHKNEDGHQLQSENDADDQLA